MLFNKHDQAAHSGEPLVPVQFLRPFVLVTGLFFLWGIPNNLNDVLIRQFMKSFALTRFQAGLVQFPFYMGYFLLAMPAALLMKKFGYKAGILTGLVLFACGDFLFLPAAIAGRYAYFLCALFVIASGLSFLETASNSFIAQLGAQASSERRLNLAQAFNPLGSIVGVVIGTLFIFSGIELSRAQVAVMQASGTYADYLRHETLRVVSPYLGLGCLALLFAAAIAVTKFPVIQREEEHGAGQRSPIAYRRLACATFAQFMYIGAQVGTWSYFIQYVQDSTQLHERAAGYLLSTTLAAFLAGRFASAQLMKTFHPTRLLGLYALINVVLVLGGVAFHNWLGVAALLMTSFFMAPMFPTIFATGIKDLGPATKVGGSLLVMAIIGGAVWTPIMGWIAVRAHQIAAAYQIPLYAYICIAIMMLIIGRLESQERMRNQLNSLELSDAWPPSRS